MVHGEDLNLVSQMQASLFTSRQAINATVQVQKDALVDLLLGTDLLTTLGFNHIQSGDDDSRTVHVIQEGEWKGESSNSPSLPAPEQVYESKEDIATPSSATVTPSMAEAEQPSVKRNAAATPYVY